jgi:NADH-quinone oxidoreductase subunit I
MEQPPHPMRLGDSEKDYYLGSLTNPGTSAGAERAGGADASQPGEPLSRGAA